MMEGESGTPAVARVPDEETAFIGRKVEAPKRRQRLQQQRSQRKRVAVVAVSTVTALAVGAICVFLPSGAPDDVKATVSQAMASAPASSKRVFVPSFSEYDEDGDGKVTLGEYLDRMAINLDAALQHVDDSDLEETEKNRITDLLKEDFGKHSDCVTQIAQEHEDDFMTKDNFDDKYKDIMAICPTDDDHIPNSYQVNEVAEGHEELVDEEESSGERSSSTSEWNPEEPTVPPRPSTDSNDAKSKQGAAGSKPNEEKLWSPDYPTSPPTPSRTDSKAEKWSPRDPPEPPRVASHDEESVSSPSESKEDPKETGIGDDEWNPMFPTQPPDRKEEDPMKTGVGDGDWNPANPTLPPDPSTRKKPAETGIGDGNWNPTDPTSPPSHSARTNEAHDNQVSDEEGGGTEFNPESEGQESPYGEQKNPEGKQTSGAFNAFTSGETGAYGENPRSEGAGQESPYGEQKNPEGEQTSGAFNAFTSGETVEINSNRGNGGGDFVQPRSDEVKGVGEDVGPGSPAEDFDNPWRQLRVSAH
ncbi:hypothetical protein P3T76_013110 [Phytophthora citrophthora]|uniref:EF-hand domain-containing protein n=1 Tax=Phytophthora citrophthora TaxID=4793 RepID=A0AAD9G3I4_9STRA|nr:hypothetical protein P3T76_013110 [Phytophthora citrophthora]